MANLTSVKPEGPMEKWAEPLKNSEVELQKPPGGLLARTIKSGWYFSYSVGLLCAKGKFIKNMLAKGKRYDPKDEKRQAGEVVVITGGPRGIAYELAKKFLKLDFIVIMGARDLKFSQARIDKIRSEGVTDGTSHLLELNLNSLASTKDFAHNVLALTSRVDILINNAGIMMTPYECTKDGLEGHFQINYLSHFLLSKLLLPTIIKTSAEIRRGNYSCRIINTSSIFHLAGSLDFDDLETRKVYSASKCYCDSKLCQVLYTKELEKRLQQQNVNVHTYTVHPGAIVTDLWDGAGRLFKMMKWIKPMLPSAEDGADTVMQLALSTKLEELGGCYFEGLKLAKANSETKTLAYQEKLWSRSEHLIEHFC